VTEDPLDTFFGIDRGANVSLGLKYWVLDGFEAKVSYTRSEKEYGLGAAYSRRFPGFSLRSRIDVEFFSYEELSREERAQNIFSQLVLQTEFVEDRIKPVLTAGYDGYNERIGFAVGLSAIVLEGGYLFEEVTLIGEYFPLLRDDEGVSYLGEKNCFAAGIGLKTWGHQFMLLVGNTSEIGTRRLMLGSNADDLFLGFNVRRLLREE
jgi:hypothetical protein